MREHNCNRSTALASLREITLEEPPTYVVNYMLILCMMHHSTNTVGMYDTPLHMDEGSSP